MGVCQSVFVPAELKEQYRISRLIEKDLERKTNILVQKVLLLGPGECGKSTCLKQMRMMMHIEFTPHELAEKRLVVFLNIMQAMQAILEYMDRCSLQLRDDLIQERVVITEHIAVQGVNCSRIPPEVGASLKRLWKNEQVQVAYEQRAKYHVTDSTAYFFENLDRITDDGFVPNNTDILHTRVPTTGVVQVDFSLKGIRFEVYDVGGQRSERKKWIRCFDGVNAVLFVAAVSEFDQRIREDNETVQNRIEEALKLYYEIVNSVFFKESSMILFLNKKDLFAKKVKRVLVSVFFPEFIKENTYEYAMAFFRSKFESCMLSRTRKPYVHETCAIANTVQIVINSVIDTIVQENLKDTGMI